MLVSILGPGSFGTAIAQLISQNVDDVNIFGRDNSIINSINKENVNHIYHPMIKLNKNIKAYNIHSDGYKLENSDLVVFSVPSGSTRSVAHQLAEHINDKLILSSAKGIEYPSLSLMSRIIKEETGNENIFSISGPMFADELIRNNLTGMTLGINNRSKKDIFKIFSAPHTFIDYSDDVEGVELSGVLKNVYASVMGIFDTFYQSHNEHYTLLNLCFKEMNSILEHLGHPGLKDKFCVFGDFNLTANEDKSRNRTLGLMLAKNISMDMESSTITIESLKSIKAAESLTQNLELNTPILEILCSTLKNPKNIRSDLSNFLKESQW